MILDVIIPMYNGEKYIKNLLDAFRAQTVGSFKLIIVNDGSTDNTSSLLHNNILTRGLDIVIIDQINAGVGAARNRGATAASDDLITFFDADDLPEKDYVETIINSFNNNSIDCFVFQRVSVDDNNLVIKENHCLLGDGIYSCEKVLASMFFSEIDVCVFTIAIPLGKFRANELRCLENCKNLEDVNFSYQIIASSKNVKVSNKVLYRYLIQTISATTKYNVLKDYRKSIEVMSSLQEVFDKRDLAFANMYRKWGYSKIVWTITWQAVMVTKSYASFLNFSKKIKSKNSMLKLYNFPKKHVSYSARLFSISPFFYYWTVKFFGKGKDRSSHSETNI